MPLLRHPPAAGISPWNRKGFHGAWTTYITEALNKHVLPAGYRAVPTINVSTQAQVDIATLHLEDPATSEAGNGAVATAVWAPPHPPLVIATDLADLDVFEISVASEEGGYQLVAAIELVSPANKDRPEHRQAFAAKCAAYLQNRIGLVVVDIITERRANLHAELMGLLNLGEAAQSAADFEMYAVAYRAAAHDDKPRLEVWPARLQVGNALPTLPLWIGEEKAVPLDLEASYTATCESLRLA